MARPLAIFDIDGTIFRSSFSFELMERMIKDGVVPREARTNYEREYRRWLDREGRYDDFEDMFKVSAAKYWKGIHYGEFADTSKIVVAEHSKHTYRYTRKLITELKEQGYFLLAISHSPKTIIDPFCKNLGFDKSYGVVWEIGPQDLLTGHVTDGHIIWNKANIVKRVLEKQRVSLKGSVGVGDTDSDISFLEMVERPICFNPNKKLYTYAKRMKWKVVVERKDVIYEL
jgi:HAD superfamily hydrolase (TIGR01490 family)